MIVINLLDCHCCTVLQHFFGRVLGITRLTNEPFCSAKFCEPWANLPAQESWIAPDVRFCTSGRH